MHVVSSSATSLAALSLSFLFAGACGGIVVVDGGSGGAGGGPTTAGPTTAGPTTGPGPTTTTTTGGGAPSTSSGPSGCTDHADCVGGVCVFSTGTCAEACEASSCDACAPGTYCEPCATSSCPSCKDCRPACVAVEGRCDDNDPCPAGETCIYAWGICAPLCAGDFSCDPFSFCDGCATGSCCGCFDCVAACVGGE